MGVGVRITLPPAQFLFQTRSGHARPDQPWRNHSDSDEKSGNEHDAQPERQRHRASGPSKERNDHRIPISDGKEHSCRRGKNSDQDVENALGKLHERDCGNGCKTTSPAQSTGGMPMPRRLAAAVGSPIHCLLELQTWLESNGVASLYPNLVPGQGIASPPRISLADSERAESSEFHTSVLGDRLCNGLDQCDGHVSYIASSHEVMLSPNLANQVCPGQLRCLLRLVLNLSFTPKALVFRK